MSEEGSLFFEWLKSQGGQVDTDAMGLQTFEDTGRGAVALRDIERDEVLFDIPRYLVLSTRTSELPGLIGGHGMESLGSGWAGLILCMMWEAAKGESSKWSGYMTSMPATFSTLMFWSDEELSELRGSMVTEKIGKLDVENDYHQKVVPLLRTRPDLFPPETLSTRYSLDQYHINGSRILSRSFHVEPWTGESNDTPGDEGSEHQDGMEVDGASSPAAILNGPASDQGMVVEDSTSEDDDEKDDPANVGMVPLADLLNARHGCNNARLFYEKNSLKMMATKKIPKGTQIWNTYGDLPNSDLLRQYGHVDMVPTEEFGLGNPADVVEVKADLIVDAVGASGSHERIDFFLEEGGDDVFVLDMSFEIPEEFLVLIRLLLLPQDDWLKSKEKGKLPKPKADLNSMEITAKVLNARIRMYPTSIETDEALLSQKLSSNHRNAVIVRLGEKRILGRTLEKLEEEIQRMKSPEKGKKRKPDFKKAGDAKRNKQGF